MTSTALEAERAHLAGLLEAIQLCVFEHFNSLHTLIPDLYGDAARFLAYCQEALGVLPIQGDFANEFTAIVSAQNLNNLAVP